jgi:hypothetical protein
MPLRRYHLSILFTTFFVFVRFTFLRVQASTLRAPCADYIFYLLSPARDLREPYKGEFSCKCDQSPSLKETRVGSRQAVYDSARSSQLLRFVCYLERYVFPPKNECMKALTRTRMLGIALMPLQLLELAIVIPRAFYKLFYTRTPREHAELNAPPTLNLGTVYPQVRFTISCVSGRGD